MGHFPFVAIRFCQLIRQQENENKFSSVYVCVLKGSMCVTFTATCVIDSRHEASAMNPMTKPASSLRSTYRSYP